MLGFFCRLAVCHFVYNQSVPRHGGMWWNNNRGLQILQHQQSKHGYTCWSLMTSFLYYWYGSLAHSFHGFFSRKMTLKMTSVCSFVKAKEARETYITTSLKWSFLYSYQCIFYRSFLLLRISLVLPCKQIVIMVSGDLAAAISSRYVHKDFTVKPPIKDTPREAQTSEQRTNQKYSSIIQNNLRKRTASLQRTKCWVPSVSIIRRFH